MKVLLINPPIDNMITTNIPAYVDEERGYAPPLGIMYVASYAEHHTNFKIQILDMLAEEVGYDELKYEIKKRKPDIIGITTMTFTLIDAMLTAKIIKNINPEIKIVLGGPHVNIFPDETIKHPEIDFLILGEGEITFTEFLKNIDSPTKLRKVPGIVFKHNQKVINTGERKLIENLDILPFPARHLTKIEKYSSLLAKRSPITTMMTSRGCPYDCLFCDRPHLGKRFRARSAKNVVDEMEECAKMGIHEFLLYDDTTTIDRHRIIDICDLILKNNLDIGWDIRARVDTVDMEMLRSLKRAGCNRIHYGIESANPRILNLLRKRITLQQVEKAIEMTKKVGIETLAYFMIGSPTETREEIMNTIEYAKKLKPDYAHFSITTPFPATPLYYFGIEQEIFDDYWRTFAENPTKDFIPKVWEDDLNKEELTQLLEYAYKSFYTRPTYALNKLFQIRSFSELQRKATAGYKLIR